MLCVPTPAAVCMRCCGGWRPSFFVPSRVERGGRRRAGAVAGPCSRGWDTHDSHAPPACSCSLPACVFLGACVSGASACWQPGAVGGGRGRCSCQALGRQAPTSAHALPCSGCGAHWLCCAGQQAPCPPLFLAAAAAVAWSVPGHELNPRPCCGSEWPCRCGLWPSPFTVYSRLLLTTVARTCLICLPADDPERPPHFCWHVVPVCCAAAAAAATAAPGAHTTAAPVDTETPLGLTSHPL